jgi:hypothetical protein
VRYFLRRASSLRPSSPVDAIHFLNPTERAGLARVQRGAIVRAAVAGALSTFVAAAVEVFAIPRLGVDPDLSLWLVPLSYWLVIGGANVVTSALEVGFLYWDGLRTVHELSRVAGLDLVAGQGDQRLAAALARAALELPDPASPVFGIDPLRGVSRLRLVAAALFYKLKVSLSTFLTKLLVRRMLGRAALRTLVPFVAVPVTAVWNAVVCWRVLRQARLRTFGPSASAELVGLALGEVSSLSARGRLAAFRAVGSAVVAKRDLHPNLVALLFELRSRSGEPARATIDDAAALLEDLRQLSPGERAAVLRLLSVASVIDGRLTRSEQRLIVQARAVAGLGPDLAATRRLHRAFVGGEGFEPKLLRELAE